MKFQAIDNNNKIVWMGCLDRDCNAKLFENEELARQYVENELENGTYIGTTDGKWVEGDNGMWYIDSVGWYDPMEIYQNISQVR